MCDWFVLPLRGPRRLCERDSCARFLGLGLCPQHERAARTAVIREVLDNPGLAQEIQRLLYHENAERIREERRRRAAEALAQSVVYFVERDGFVKIGVTTQLQTRLKALARGGQMPEGMTVGPVQLLATMPGGTANEAWLHDRFAQHRIPKTEWFYPAPDLMQFVSGLKGYRRRASAA